MIMGLLVVYSCWVWPTLILLGEPEKKKNNKTKQNKKSKTKFEKPPLTPSEIASF